MLGPRKRALKKGEFVVSFLLPPRPPRSSDAYLRFIPRTEMDIAVVGAGVSLTVDAGGTITAARVSLGAVAARVLLVPAAAQAIIGSRLDRPAQDQLEAAAPSDLRTDRRQARDDRIPRQVAGVLTRRAALIAGRGPPDGKHHQATVNGATAEFLCETEDTLLGVLRDTLQLTGSGKAIVR
jgi:carbon-monoxide dehydrogenase medium subunit